MIFITGATGFLGAYITHYLVESGASVRALKRADSSLDLCTTFRDKVEWIDGDLNDIDALMAGMKDAEKVYHIAGLVSFDPSDRQAVYKVNYKGTQNVVNAALESNVRKILYASSIAAIGRSSKTDVVTEDTEWSSSSKWNSAYGDSKRKGEMEVWRGAAEGLEAIAVNPSIILGSGFWKGSLAFTRTVDKGLKYYPGGRTGYVDVRDVAQICIKLMDSALSGERYILSAEDVYFKDFLTALAQHQKVKPPSALAGPMATELVWRLEWIRTKLSGRKPIITKKTARFSQKEWTFSNDKIRAALDYTFRDIDQSIQDMCEDYLKSKEEGKRYAFRP